MAKHILTELANDSTTVWIPLVKFSYMAGQEDPMQSITDMQLENINEQTKLIFDYSAEGFFLPWIHQIHRMLPFLKTKKIFYITEAHNAQELYDTYCEQNNIEQKINIIILSLWENNLRYNHVHPNEYEIKVKQKKFTCFNRISRPHRLILLALLKEKNLLNEGFYSYCSATHSDKLSTHLSSSVNTFEKDSLYLKNIIPNDFYNRIHTSLLEVKDQIPILLNIRPGDNVNYVKDDDRKYFENSYFSVVTETTYFPTYWFADGYPTLNEIFFSEKIFKPIAMMHPFVLVAAAHSLKALKKLNYKTFSPFINESYDDIDDDIERLLAIVAEIERLCNLSEEEFIQFQQNIKPIVEYNRKIFMEKDVSEHILQNPYLPDSPIVYDVNEPLIKVYMHNGTPFFGQSHEHKLSLITHGDFLPFEIEKKYFVPTSNFEEAHIVATTEPNTFNVLKYLNFPIDKKLLVVIRHTHISEDECQNYNNYIDFYKKSNASIRFVSTALPTEYYEESVIFYDFLFNRQKCYYVDYDKFDLNNRLWTFGSTKKMYQLAEILHKQTDTTNFKKFLSPNKFLPERSVNSRERNYYRKLLSDHLSSQDTFFSNFSENPPIFLKSQEHISGETYSWSPVHNDYYMNSFVSVFVETLTWGNEVRAITEKTFDPLIKGHFILPFGYCGMIFDLRTKYGIKFPDWIDYSYDRISDTELRFNKFIESFDKLKKMNFDTLIQNFNADIDILKHNRQIFFDRPYDSLYEKLKPYLNI